MIEDGQFQITWQLTVIAVFALIGIAFGAMAVGTGDEHSSTSAAAWGAVFGTIFGAGGVIAGYGLVSFIEAFPYAAALLFISLVLSASIAVLTHVYYENNKSKENNDGTKDS